MADELPKNLFTATTSAVSASSATQVYIPNGTSVLFVAEGLATTEEVDFYRVKADGTAAVLLDDSAAALTLTATDYQVRINGPINVQIAKDATAAAATVSVQR